MDQAKFDEIKAEIDIVVDQTTALAGVVAPEFLPYIVLGKGMAKALPEIFEQVEKLLTKVEPSDADKADLAKVLHDLANPEEI